MKFHELIKTNNWLSVEITFLNLYPDQKKNIEGYNEIFAELQKMKPGKSNMQIVLELQEKDDFYDEPFVHVYGLEIKPKSKKTERYGLDFVKRKKWLDMTINENTLKEYTELEIISHCLYEMTFYGYDEKDIQNEWKKIKRQIDEIKSWTPEEREKNLISSEEVFRRLDEKFKNKEE